MPSKSSSRTSEPAAPVVEGPSLLVKRQVTVKARLTEALRQKLAADFQDAVRKLDVELSQLEFQGKRLQSEAEKQGPERAAAVSSQLTGERQKRQEQKQRILESLKELGKMPLGTEIVQGSVESLAEIRLGDRLALVTAAEVVVEDGIVVAIRDGGVAATIDGSGRV